MASGSVVMFSDTSNVQIDNGTFNNVGGNQYNNCSFVPGV